MMQISGRPNPAASMCVVGSGKFVAGLLSGYASSHRQSIGIGQQCCGSRGSRSPVLDLASLHSHSLAKAAVGWTSSIKGEASATCSPQACCQSRVSTTAPFHLHSSKTNQQYSFNLFKVYKCNFNLQSLLCADF